MKSIFWASASSRALSMSCAAKPCPRNSGSVATLAIPAAGDRCSPSLNHRGRYQRVAMILFSFWLKTQFWEKKRGYDWRIHSNIFHRPGEKFSSKKRHFEEKWHRFLAESPCKISSPSFSWWNYTLTKKSGAIYCAPTYYLHNTILLGPDLSRPNELRLNSCMSATSYL